MSKNEELIRAIKDAENEPHRLGRRPQLVRSRGYDKQDDEQIFS